jgi:predicted porin
VGVRDLRHNVKLEGTSRPETFAVLQLYRLDRCRLYLPLYSNPRRCLPSAFDGVNLTSPIFFGDWEIAANGLFGRVEDDENLYTDLSTSYRVWGGNIEATYDDWIKLRVAVIQYEDFLFDGELGGEGSGIRLAAFDPIYYGTSLSLTPGNWLLVAEYTWYKLNIDNLITGVPGTKVLNDLDEAWYVSAAYTSGKWTPHLTYSHSEFSDDDYNVGFAARDDSTIIAGVRYDFHPSASLKLEYHLTDDESKVNGIDAPTDGHDHVDVIEFAMDLIF